MAALTNDDDEVELLGAALAGTEALLDRTIAQALEDASLDRAREQRFDGASAPVEQPVGEDETSRPLSLDGGANEQGGSDRGALRPRPEEQPSRALLHGLHASHDAAAKHREDALQKAVAFRDDWRRRRAAARAPPPPRLPRRRRPPESGVAGSQLRGVAAAGATILVGAVAGPDVAALAVLSGAALGADAVLRGASDVIDRRVIPRVVNSLATRLGAVGDWNSVAGDRVRVAPRGAVRLPYAVARHDVLRWEFCVRAHDVRFSVSERRMASGGAVEVGLLPASSFTAGSKFGGAWTAEEATTLLLVFDNAYSLMTPKDVAVAVSVRSATYRPAEESLSAMAAYRREWHELHTEV